MDEFVKRMVVSESLRIVVSGGHAAPPHFERVVGCEPEVDEADDSECASSESSSSSSEEEAEEEAEDGEESDGEKSDGEKSDGEESDGEESDGEESDGETPEPASREGSGAGRGGRGAAAAGRMGRLVARGGGAAAVVAARRSARGGGAAGRPVRVPEPPRRTTAGAVPGAVPAGPLPRRGMGAPVASPAVRSSPDAEPAGVRVPSARGRAPGGGPDGSGSGDDEVEDEGSLGEESEEEEGDGTDSDSDFSGDEYGGDGDLARVRLGERLRRLFARVTDRSGLVVSATRLAQLARRVGLAGTGVRLSVADIDIAFIEATVSGPMADRVPMHFHGARARTCAGVNGCRRSCAYAGWVGGWVGGRAAQSFASSCTRLPGSGRRVSGGSSRPSLRWCAS